MHPLGWVGFLPPHCTPSSLLSAPLGSFFSLFLDLAGFLMRLPITKSSKAESSLSQSSTGHHPEPSPGKVGRFSHHSRASPAPRDPLMPWKPEREAPGSKTKVSHHGFLQDVACPACHLPGPAGAAPSRPRSSGSLAGAEGREKLGQGMEWEKRRGSPCIGTSGSQHPQNAEREKGKLR